MIASLRKAHRLSFVLLAFALPLLCILALRARQAPPPPQSLGFLPAPAPVSGSPLHTGEIAGLHFEVYQGMPPQGTPLQLLVTTNHELKLADPLLYWSQEPPSATAPALDAILLGEVGSGARHQFSLPDTSTNSAGYLTLYSPAKGSVEASAAVAGKGGSL